MVPASRASAGGSRRIFSGLSARGFGPSSSRLISPMKSATKRVRGFS